MVLFRSGRALISLVACVLPLAILWLVMRSYAGSEFDPLPKTNIQVPGKTGPAFLGPVEVLVYADPWFADTAWYWLIFCGVVALGLVLWAVFYPVENDSLESLGVWGLDALLVGMLLAGPWFYGLAVLIARE